MLGRDPQNRVGPPFDRGGLGQIDRDLLHGNGVGEGEIQDVEGVGERGRVMGEDPVHRFVRRTDHARRLSMIEPLFESDKYPVSGEMT